MTSPRSVIIVTLDCVRPDHLGCYGYQGVDTSNIDQIAKEGVVFEQAITHAPNTWVSHASFFTGCNPFTHGIRTQFTILSEKVFTLAQAFQEAGFATAAFPAHTLVGEHRGFARGFDHYDLNQDDFIHEGSLSDNRYYKPWDMMWERAQKWMSEQTEPFFVWLHYMGTHWEPHEMVSVPEEFRRNYSPLGQFFDGKISWADKECIGEIKNFLSDQNIYDDSILVVMSDHGDDLPANDPPYRYGGHNQNLYDIVMKIAMIIRAPGKIKPGARVLDQFRGIDLMPTLLGLAEIPIPATVEGVDFSPSLNDPHNSDKFPNATLAYMENLPRHWVGVRTPKWKLIITDLPDPNIQAESGKDVDGDTLSVIFQAMKVFVGTLREQKMSLHPFFRISLETIQRGYQKLKELIISPREASQLQRKPRRKPELTPLAAGNFSQTRVFSLYNLHEDPDELVDVSANHLEIVEQLKKEVEILLKGSDSSNLQNLDEKDQDELEKHLKALGYL